MKRVYFCPIELIYRKGSKTFTTPKGYPADGATGAMDIYSYSWFAHDRACDHGKWDDGSMMTPKEASAILAWYLKREKRTWRTRVWKRMTLWFGPKRLGLKGECPSFPELAGQVQLIRGGRDSLYRKDFCGCGALGGA